MFTPLAFCVLLFDDQGVPREAVRVAPGIPGIDPSAGQSASLSKPGPRVRSQGADAAGSGRGGDGPGTRIVEMDHLPTTL